MEKTPKELSPLFDASRKTSRKAKDLKGKLTDKEFLDMCIKVVEHAGYSVQMKEVPYVRQNS